MEWKTKTGILKKPVTWAIPIMLVAVLLVTGVLNSNSIVDTVTDAAKSVFTIGTDTVYAAGTPDYTCDGVADDVEFQAAVNALPADGGSICILAGTYNFTATVTRAIDNVMIEGVGAGTVINNNGVAALFSAGAQDGWHFRDFTTDAGGITTAAASHVSMTNMTIGATYYAYWSSADADVNFDFNTLEALSMCCENGATFPTTPADGMWFRHQPTGRDILYQYDGGSAAWLPIIGLDSMTVYVDKTDGTDNLDHGTGVDANAFATIQYAIDVIPPERYGTVSIYINNENYNEDVELVGKNATNGHTINIYGTLASQETEAGATVAAGGGGTSAGTVSGTLAADYSDMLVYFATDDEYRLVDSNTFTLGYDSGSVEPSVGDIITGQTSNAWATIVAVNHSGGTWAGGDDSGTFTLHVTSGTFQNNELLDNETTPQLDFATVDTGAGNSANNNIVLLVGKAPSSTGQDVTFYDWGTQVNSLFTGESWGVSVYDIYFDEGIERGNGFVFYNRCKMEASADFALHLRTGGSDISYCYATSDMYTVYAELGYEYMYGCKIVTSSTFDRSVLCNNNGFINLRSGTVLEAASLNTTYGVYAGLNGVVSFYTSGSTCYPRVRNQAVGAYANQGGQVVSTTNVQYSGNTADESADAASFGYID